MGGFLEKPITTGIHETSNIQIYNIGLNIDRFSISGCRTHQEDRSVEYKGDGWYFFGTLDGHGGKQTSEYMTTKLPEFIQDFSKKYNIATGDYEVEDLQELFIQADIDLLNSEKSMRSGSTFSGGILFDFKDNCCSIITINIGDSFTIATSTDGGDVMTIPHKPDDKKEKDRIIKAGGYVEKGRVDGNLALSRALGDFHYKNENLKNVDKSKVIPIADINTGIVYYSDGKIITGSDGITDVITQEEVCSTNYTGSIDLVDQAIDKDSKDNITATIITFKSLPITVYHNRECRLKDIHEEHLNNEEVFTEILDPIFKEFDISIQKNR